MPEKIARYRSGGEEDDRGHPWKLLRLSDRPFGLQRALEVLRPLPLGGHDLVFPRIAVQVVGQVGPALVRLVLGKVHRPVAAVTVANALGVIHRSLADRRVWPQRQGEV